MVSGVLKTGPRSTPLCMLTGEVKCSHTYTRVHGLGKWHGLREGRSTAASVEFAPKMRGGGPKTPIISTCSTSIKVILHMVEDLDMPYRRGHESS